MMLIDAHAHMISRTTDDYQAMAAAGVSHASAHATTIAKRTERLTTPSTSGTRETADT